MTNVTIDLTEKAQNHFRRLIEAEQTRGMNLRVCVEQPMTSNAEVGITFCPPNAEQPTDIAIEYDFFTLYVEQVSVPALEDAQIDYIEDTFGGQLSVKAPYIRGRTLDKNLSFRDQVKHVLDAQINPSLAGHGGMVTLIDILEGPILLLRFGGGCQGCGMANVTLKQGIEKVLREQFPQLVDIQDVTDHESGKNPYY